MFTVPNTHRDDRELVLSDIWRIYNRVHAQRIVSINEIIF
jgi:hypothetical protein